MQHLLASIWFGVIAFFVFWLLSFLLLGDDENYKYWMFVPITALAVLSSLTFYYV